MDKSNRETIIGWRRRGNWGRLKLQNATNYETRELMIGLFFRLDLADRLDHIAELGHYLTDPNALLSPVASAVKNAGGIDAGMDLSKQERVKPW